MEKIKLDKKIVIPTGIALLIVLCFVLYNAIVFQTTDDAYVENLYVQVAPKVKGEIIEVLVEDNQKVKEGDLIAKIDDRDYKVAYDMAAARYKKALLNQTNAKANFSAVSSQLALAKRDLERY